jgi:hypothetical protein
VPKFYWRQVGKKPVKFDVVDVVHYSFDFRLEGEMVFSEARPAGGAF